MVRRKVVAVGMGRGDGFRGDRSETERLGGWGSDSDHEVDDSGWDYY